MKNNNPQQKSRTRKLLLILPLLVLPFVTMLFWAMGGGSATEQGAGTQKGFNLTLPSAQFKEGKEPDKLNYYDQASLDSTKLDELRRKDPNYRFTGQDSAVANTVGEGGGLRMDHYQSPQEEKVYKRLEQLQQAINQPAPIAQNRSAAERMPAESAANYEAQLRQMLQPMDEPSQPDPEMEQISGMLDNILNLQYPERMEQKLKAESVKNRGRIYAVASTQEHEVIGSISSPVRAQAGTFGSSVQHGFYGLEQQSAALHDNAIAAVIAGTQNVVNGATVKLALTQDIYVNGNKIPKNTYVYGVAGLKGERLTVAITSIRHGSSIYPVELAVVDLDGLDGIYIPGAINREVAKSSADRSVQTLGVTTLSDSWGAQAAGVGIEAAKGLFSRKVKLIKVTLKAGYAVLLKDEKQKDN